MSRRPGPAPEHGTRACYARGCGRPECRAADYAAKVERKRAIIRGDWDPFADAAPVREHVAALAAAGLTERNVARLAGVWPGSVAHLMHGSGGLPPGRRVRHETAARILAVRAPDVPARGLLCATGTVRRLQALMAAGWPQATLARELGMTPANLSAVVRGSRGERVRAPTAAAVRDLYDRVWDQPPAQGTSRQAADSRLARERAAAKGWAPPMAWDDDGIDDPAASPAAGWRRGRRRDRAGLLADYAELLAWQTPPDVAASRLGMTRDAVHAAAGRDRRAQREDYREVA